MKTMKLTGLYKAKDKDGATYLNGKLAGNVYITVRPNVYKRDDRDPDYMLFFTQPEAQQSASAPTKESEQGDL